MAEQKSKLVVMMKRLIVEGEKGSRKLPGELFIGYTPGESGGRVVWSRRESAPSEVEDVIMGAAVKKALQEIEWDNDVDVIGIEVKSGLTIQEGWGSSSITWQWAGGEEEE